MNLSNLENSTKEKRKRNGRHDFSVKKQFYFFSHTTWNISVIFLKMRIYKQHKKEFLK
jgi:hypothetical protein